MKSIITFVVLLAIVSLMKAKDMKRQTPAFLRGFKKTYKRSGDGEIYVQIRWMKQPLDHFDKENNRTWKMRYMMNKKYFKNGGPMFIVVGGEWKIEEHTIQSGLFTDIAKEHKGILLYTEHRYYGASHPTSDFSKENLKYLHSRQALADLAHFIRMQREFDPRLANSKVILSGHSYAGSLVVWFKKLYPELVNGGWASSAPLLAKVDFNEFYQIYGNNFREIGSQYCYNRIENSILELEAMFSDDRGLIAKSMLLLCDSFDPRNILDLWTLFFYIADAFTKSSNHQTHKDVSDFCDYIVGFEDDLPALVAVFTLEYFTSPYCIDISYKTMFESFSDITVQSGSPIPWFYQLCNEFGWHANTIFGRQPFGNNAPSFLQKIMCSNLFGSEYTNEYMHKLTEKTNQMYGGSTPGVQNVYMTYGDLEPWKEVGCKETQGVSVIPLAGHCADIKSIKSFDSPEMLASKHRLLNLVQEWLS